MPRLFLLFLLAALPASSSVPLAPAHPPPTDREVVTITWDADGAVRERRIWFALLQDVLYVRTTRLATWGGNVEREGGLTLVSGTARTDFVARRVDDPVELENVHRGFRDKYGRDDWWADRVRWLFGGKVTFRLTRRGDASVLDEDQLVGIEAELVRPGDEAIDEGSLHDR